MVIVAVLGRVCSAGLREAIEGGPTCSNTPHDVLDHLFTRHGKPRSIIGVDAGVFIAWMSDPDGIATVLQHRIQGLKGVSANCTYLSGKFQDDSWLYRVAPILAGSCICCRAAISGFTASILVHSADLTPSANFLSFILTQDTGSKRTILSVPF